MKGKRLPIPKNHEDWLNQRRNGITGTDMGGLLGITSYKSPMSIYVDKVSAPLPKPPSEGMLLGNHLEEPIAQLWLAKNPGHTLRKINTTIRNCDHPWIMSNIDRHITKPQEGLVECKLVGLQKAKEWKDGGIPDEYYVQVMWQMITTGIKEVQVAALIGGNSFEQRVVKYDEAVATDLIKVASDFWHNHVLKRIPPELDGSTVTTDAITRMYHGDTSETAREVARRFIGNDDLDLGYEADQLLKHYAERSETIKALKDHRDGLTKIFISQWEAQTGVILETIEAKNVLANELRMKVGQFQKAFTPEGGKVTWLAQTSKRLDGTRLKNEMPEVAELYSKESTSYPLRVTQPKK
jgi:putative phage-type endonuclease